MKLYRNKEKNAWGLRWGTLGALNMGKMGISMGMSVIDGVGCWLWVLML